MKLWERIKRYEENTPQDIKDRIKELQDKIQNRKGFPYLSFRQRNEDGDFEGIFEGSILKYTPSAGMGDMNVYGRYYKLHEYPFYIFGWFYPISRKTLVLDDEYFVIERDIESYITDLENAVTIDTVKEHFGINKEEE